MYYVYSKNYSQVAVTKECNKRSREREQTSGYQLEGQQRGRQVGGTNHWV